MASGGGSPLYPEILQYCTMILQRIRIIVVDAGFEPGTSAIEVWRTTNEPPHLQSATLSCFPTKCNIILFSNKVQHFFSFFFVYFFGLRWRFPPLP